MAHGLTARTWKIRGIGLATHLLLVPGVLHAQVGDGVAFIRGDVDGDRTILLTDAVGILRYLFLGNPDRLRCLDAADVDDDGQVIISDAIHLLNALFLGSAPPAAPFPVCGPDPTDDGLACESSASCVNTFQFYGQEFEADGVFFVVDRSGSMNDSGELAVAKREIVRTLVEEQGLAQFAIIFFDSNVLSFPVSGQPADGRQEENVNNALAFVNQVGRGSASCVQKGLLTALRFVGESTAARNVIIYVGDGGGTCGGDEATYLAQTLAVVTEANNGRAAIHAFGVLMSGRASQEQFLRQLVAANDGTYTRIN